MKTKSNYLFDVRGTDRQNNGIDFGMYLLSKTIQIIYDTPTKAEN